MAEAPYWTEPGPRMISMRSTLSMEILARFPVPALRPSMRMRTWLARSLPWVSVLNPRTPTDMVELGYSRIMNPSLSMRSLKSDTESVSRSSAVNTVILVVTSSFFSLILPEVTTMDSMTWGFFAWAAL